MTTSNAHARTETRAGKGSMRRSYRPAARRGWKQSWLQFPGILILACLCVALLGGCGSSSSGLMVEVNPNNTQTVDEGQPLLFTASVSDNNTKGVTWTLTGTGCAGSGCGILTAITTTSVTYIAPSGRTSQLSVSLEA